MRPGPRCPRKGRARSYAVWDVRPVPSRLGFINRTARGRPTAGRGAWARSHWRARKGQVGVMRLVHVGCCGCCGRAPSCVQVIELHCV